MYIVVSEWALFNAKCTFLSTYQHTQLYIYSGGSMTQQSISLYSIELTECSKTECMHK